MGYTHVVTADGKVLLVTVGIDESNATELMQAGISGIFLKRDLPNLLSHAIRHVAGGGVWFKQEQLQSAMACHPESERQNRVEDSTCGNSRSSLVSLTASPTKELWNELECPRVRSTRTLSCDARPEEISFQGHWLIHTGFFNGCTHITHLAPADLKLSYFIRSKVSEARFATCVGNGT